MSSKNSCVVFLMHFHEAVRWITEVWDFQNGPSIFFSSDEGECEDGGTQSRPQPGVRARQPVRHVSNVMRHSKVTSHVRLYYEFYADLDEEINPNCNSCTFILLQDLNRPRQTLVGSRYPPPSPPHTQRHTPQGSHFSPSPMGLWQVWERVCLHGRQTGRTDTSI